MLSTIRAKMTAIGLAVFVLAAGSAGVGLWVSGLLEAGLANETLSAGVLRNHMEADMMHDALRSDVLAAILAGNPSAKIDIAAVKGDLSAHITRFRDVIAENQGLAEDGETRAALSSVDALLATYIASAERIVGLAATNSYGAMRELSGFMMQFSALEGAMETASDRIEAVSVGIAARAAADSALGSALMQGALGIAALFAAGLMLFTRAAIIRPIAMLSDDMNQLAKGRTDLALQGAERRDEIGRIGRAVKAFQAITLAKARAEMDAAEQRRADETTAGERAQSERLSVAQAQSFVVESLAGGLGKLAAGDLDFRLRTPFAADYETLRGDFNAAMETVEAALGAILAGAVTMRDGAGEIGIAADDLASRTEQQAASLEQTAAAIAEITAAVRKTAARAGQAQQVVATSKLDGERSGAVVRQAVAAMDQIAQSSDKVGRIIGVIDEIAFQTNLLALNAGVEAARAGEAGRGFAVVAQEVRGLAQRSAEAAKEIKNLISTSSAQVAEGVDLVGQTGDALDRIAGQVVDLNQLIEEISSSAREQAAGLGEVNLAVKQMDLMTQQNAAMVEQSTAATRTLADEAEGLLAEVGRFKVGTAPRQQSAARHHGRPHGMSARAA